MKSESSQHIYRMCIDKPVVNNCGEKRVMEELGNITGLEIDETVNYLLSPIVTNDKSTAWNIRRMTKASVVDFNKDLEKEFDVNPAENKDVTDEFK